MSRWTASTRLPEWVEEQEPAAWGPGLVRVGSTSATPSPGFVSWLTEARVNLLVTVGDRLITLGVENDALVLAEISGGLVLGVTALEDGGILLSTHWQIHYLYPADGGPASTRTRFFNQHSHTTGFVGAYDLAVDRRGRVLFSNSLCNGVATPSARYNFEVVARPPFVTAWVAEERCHVTGLGLDERGALAYLTCAGETDQAGGWREGVADGGVLVDIRGDRVLTRGLSVPNSPRVHGERLYVASAGTGELLRVDRRNGQARLVTRVPGLARGLTFVHGRALLGCSVPSTDGPYADLPIAETLAHHDIRPRHGLVVIDPRSGAQEHSVTFAAGSGEVRAVAAIPGVQPLEVVLEPARQEGWFSLETPPG